MDARPAGKITNKGETNMRMKLRSRLSLLFLSFALVLALPAMAFADVVTNNLEDNTVDNTAETMALNAPAAGATPVTGTTKLYVSNTNNKDNTYPDTENNCNLSSSADLKLNVASSDTSVATVSPASVTINSCGEGNGATLTVTPKAAGSATISVSRPSGAAGGSATGTFYLQPATFTVNVAAPPPSNTAPQVSVSGVTGGLNYEKGSVPSATCQVTDKEDGNKSFAATLDSSKLDQYGLGQQTASCSYTDNGGLKAESSVIYNIVDTGKPTSSHDLSSSANANGWHKEDVTVSLSGSDSGSGLKEMRYSATGAQTIADAPYAATQKPVISSEGETTFKYYAVDNAGNKQAEQSFTVKLDKTAPQVTSNQPMTQPNANGWYKSDVTNRFLFSDGGSGLADTTQATIDKTTSAQGSSVSVNSGPVSDVAGNTNPGVESASFSVDKTKPVISQDGVKNGTLGLNGWYTTDVGFGFTASDPNGAEGSGLAVADQTFTRSTTGEGSAVSVSSGTVTDLAGNVSDAIQSPDFKIDTKAPVITDDGPTTQPNGNGWYNSNVTNNFSAVDPNGANGSGLADAADALISKTTDTEGTAVKVASGTVSDNAGNVAASVESARFNVDKTKPVIDAKTDVNAEATDRTGALVNYIKPNATEALSGLTVVGVSCQPASGTLFALASTQVTCSAEDKAGNAADSTHFNVIVQDTIAPALNMPENKTAEATGPNGAVVSFARNANDLVDGNVAVNCLVGNTVVNSGDTFPLGTTTVSCSATDSRNNTARDSFTVTVQDTTAPALSLPTNISKLATGNSVANVTYVASANDIVDGNVAVNCSPASGSNFSVGTTTVSCSATDSRNNAAQGRFTVSVSYDWTGFFQPIDNNGVFNVAKAGSAIPVKFSLGGNQGLSVLTAGYPQTGKIACDASATTDAVEELATSTTSGLKYDALNNQYNYTWKTASSYAGTCQQLIVKMADGSVHRANFKFTK